MKNRLKAVLFFVTALCFVFAFTSPVKALPHHLHLLLSDTTDADAKTVVADYINAIGGMDAVKKLNSTSATGSLSVQGMSLDVTQKRMSPNKTVQTVTMSGNTVGKTVFNGSKGYQEQMGNRTDMSDEDMADMKTQTSIVPQVDYLTGDNYKMTVAGTEKINDADAYKVVVTMPSGKTDTEYYDVATKLLVKQVMNRNSNGQDVTATYDYGDYKKAGDVMLPYKLSLGIAAGTINQSIDIVLTDIKVNEGVTDADFE